jgi:aryl-alcohol dehydrogenase-like predicted oxidoreductase
MQFSPLGGSGLQVSRVCLGTMTWGVQNNQADADAQINYAFERGVNFMDTAEMYPIPPSADTVGATERHIGDYFKRHPEQREKWIVATKIVGKGLPWIRNGSGISAESIPVAIEGSLKQLNTDYIDLYQLHWPNRGTAHFGTHWPNDIEATKTDVAQEVARKRGVVQALGEAISAGKIRHWGLSDDTPWGIHTFLNLCDELNVPRPVSIQNEFNLLHAKDWPYLIESCVFENIAYLPWSPLAAGMLSGKYLGGARPEGSRWALPQRMGLFRDTEIANQAVAAYVQLASHMQITPSQLALKWCDYIDGVTSTIIGATTLAQLEEDIDAFATPLTASEFDSIQAIFKQYPIAF